MRDRTCCYGPCRAACDESDSFASIRDQGCTISRGPAATLPRPHPVVTCVGTQPSIPAPSG
ncbi:Hypothetical protein EPM1_2723 [Stenotrophomonas maltophilia EPM1]|nr:Hypothetical protein EPM1_2723 [Stenotrophomonas maltophilia EPM1]